MSGNYIYGEISKSQSHNEIEIQENEHSSTLKNSKISPSIPNLETYNKNIIYENDSRKRYNIESVHVSDTKRMKLSNVSHLQLMQDVVALIDDLINKVCDQVSLNNQFENCQYDSLPSNKIVKTLEKHGNICFINDAEKKDTILIYESDRSQLEESQSYKLEEKSTPNDNSQLVIIYLCIIYFICSIIFKFRYYKKIMDH